eukprot:TRINITY_DN551_c0_g1_i4.p1 TRINITY_DN551_c0_g1~~TRINITY_DN551_c0_g1_i4.p1  ORF type:complete len:259 (-),score=47.23 TRINITY_DN551_c0_g1_i4:148-924(-)
MFDYLRKNKTATQIDIKAHLKPLGFDLTINYIHTILKGWGFSRKKNKIKPWTKFKRENVISYVHFLVEVKKIPWGNLKFMDESTFKSRSFHRDYVYGPKGEIQHDVSGNYADLSDGETYTVSLMTTLSGNGISPFVMHMKEGTNCQWDFLQYIADLILGGHLGLNDVLVCDNCGIHCASASSEELFSLLDAAGVRLIFLPPYSPELNPCELIFGGVKNYLKTNRGKDKFDKEVLFAFSQVSMYSVYLDYFTCLWSDIL